MAQNFPPNPIDGDTYEGYVFDASINGWRFAAVYADTLPAGAILPWPTNIAPANFLICDGAAVSRTTYAVLFATIGTTYGAGNGTTTFNIPNMVGKTIVGRDATDAQFDVLGETGGAKTHTLAESEMPSHKHTDTGHSHRQVITANSGGPGIRWDYRQDGSAWSYDQGVDTWGSSANITYTGGSQPHNNLQPYVVANYIIKTTMGSVPENTDLASRLATLETSVAGHNDVTITSPVVGDTIVWNGSQFVNGTPVSNEPIWYDLVLTAAGWTSYGELTMYDDFCAPAYTKIGGIVSLQGMLSAGTSYSAGTVIANLPVGYRPDTNMIFPAAQDSVGRNIRVYANGDVVLGSGFTSGWVSIDNVVFPAAGVATWTEVGSAGSGSAFENSWADYGDAAYGKARYWKDTYGVVWFAGLIRPGTWGGVRAFTLPTAYQADKIQHHLVANAEGTCALRDRNDIGGVDVYNGGGTWVSLAGVIGYTASCRTLLSWKYPRAQNGANWGTAYPSVGYAQRPDGLVHLQGLHNPTNGTRVFLLPRSARKEQKQLRAQIGSDAYARLDIFGMNQLSNAEMGGLTWISGSGWRSFDGITFAPTPRSFRPKYM